MLFVGSSSIAMWKTLAEDIAPLPVINRGIRGAQVEDVNRWFDRMVAPYRARAIVFYAGENDIAAGKSVDGVLADFDTFMQRKTAAMGQTPVPSGSNAKGQSSHRHRSGHRHWVRHCEIAG